MKILHEQKYNKSDYPDYQIKVINKDDSAWYKNLKSYSSGDPEFIQRIFSLKGACFYGDWGYSRDYDKKFINSIGWSNQHYESSEVNLAPKIGSCNPPTFYDGAGILLSWPGIFTYGHWIYDVIPRIYLLTKNNIDIFDPSINLIVPNNLHTNCYEFLELLKVNYIKLNFDNGVVISEAIIPSLTSRVLSYPYEFHKEAFAWYLKNIESNSVNSNLNKSKINISYIKHTTQTSVFNPRCLTNENEIINEFSKINICTFNPLNNKLIDQIDFFKNTKNLIGLDSSAMHNIIFSENGSKQLIISSNERTNFNHLCLSSILNKPLYVYDTNHNSSEIYAEFKIIKNWIDCEVESAP